MLSFPPGYLSRAHLAVVVAGVILIGGKLLLGDGASEAALQALVVLAFSVMIVTLVLSIRRLDARRARERGGVDPFRR